MLVLTRKVGQRIRLRLPGPDGPVDVWLTLVGVDRGRARVGVEAPLTVEVMREELLPEAPPEDPGNG